MSDFWLLSIIPIVFIVCGLLMQFAKQNEFFGLRTSATLSDPEIWEKSNKVVGRVFAILGVVLLLFNLIAYLQGSLSQLEWLAIILMIVSSTGVGVFGITYSDRLKREKETMGKTLQFTVSKSFVFLMSCISVVMVMLGIFILFFPTDPITRKKFTPSGIGFIIIGLIFVIVFFNTAKKEDVQRTKLFEKNFMLFAILTLIWSLISAGLAYLL